MESRSKTNRDSGEVCPPDQISDSDTLLIPKELKQWIPSSKANQKVRKRLKWTDDSLPSQGITGSLHKVTYRKKQCTIKRVARSDQWTENAFITEATTLSNVSHKGVIGFVSMFLDRDYFYLIMQPMQHTLSDVLHKSGPWDETKTKAITFAMLQTIEYLHSENVVHRDLKPENIVFSNDEQTAPKLIDFSDAVTIEPNQSFTELSCCFVWNVHIYTACK